MSHAWEKNAHFPSSDETMGSFASTVQSLRDKLEMDQRRSGAFGNLAESMQLRISKITQIAKSRPTTRMSDYADGSRPATRMSNCADGSRPATRMSDRAEEIEAKLSELPRAGTSMAMEPSTVAAMHELAEAAAQQDINLESLQADVDRQFSNTSDDHDVFPDQQFLTEEFQDILAKAIQPKSTWKQQIESDVQERKLKHRRMSSMLQEAQEIQKVQRGVVSVSIPNLEDAFYAIAAAYDMDGDGTLSGDEVLHIMSRCQLFDEIFTATTVQNFFKSWSIGCNTIVGVNLSQEEIDNGVGFEEFETLLKWTAEMKGVTFSRITSRVIRLSKKVCDEKSSQTKRLETVFDQFCKKNAARMTTDEFLHLCLELDLYLPGKFATGDVYSVFFGTPGCDDDGIDFDGFIHAIREVGEKRGESESEVLALFASSVGAVMRADEESVRRLKMKMKQAAATNSGTAEGWRDFLQNCDEDGSGCMDWDEFLGMCREKLHLTERENHLKILFEKFDDDDSGEIPLSKLIDFIAN
eukprot:gb/GFBE01070447.1/.p1 GENE.gb/GFBE01070447.1/~~gb/GFBE01070447.1/.p1  ORF type:complete len:525 (+),score=134.38 gb/GFBE01070447.1/:1-1575(+)